MNCHVSINEDKEDTESNKRLDCLSVEIVKMCLLLLSIFLETVTTNSETSSVLVINPFKTTAPLSHNESNVSNIPPLSYTSPPESIRPISSRHFPDSPSASPAQENWVRALERARADGSIQREMLREKIAEKRKKKLSMMKGKKRREKTESELIEDRLDELGLIRSIDTFSRKVN